MQTRLSISSSVNPPSDAMPDAVPSISMAEELIATLPGVVAVRVVPNASGEVDEVHVLTTNAVLPKQTVRNIESALMARHGWRVNHKKISVAQSVELPRAADTQVQQGTSTVRNDNSSPQESSASATERVLIFDDIETRRSRASGLSCRVTLTRNGQRYAGEAQGVKSKHAGVEVAARAAVGAVIETMKGVGGEALSLALEGAMAFGAFERRFVFVAIAARRGRERAMLTGSCEVRECADTSAVLAVLDAMNRWLQLGGTNVARQLAIK